MEKFNHRKLYKSSKNKVLTGVIGGLGEFIDLDPTLLRAFFIAITVFSGIFPGLATYLFLVLIIPEPPI